MGADVMLELAEPGGDVETLDELVHLLRLELLELDVESVSTIPAGVAPAESKGVAMAGAAALLVQVNASVGALTGILTAVRAWLSRGSNNQGLSVKVTIGERTLELSHATAKQQEQLVQEFLRSS
jgi:hypothetical protein